MHRGLSIDRSLTPLSLLRNELDKVNGKIQSNVLDASLGINVK